MCQNESTIFLWEPHYVLDNNSKQLIVGVMEWLKVMAAVRGRDSTIMYTMYWWLHATIIISILVTTMSSLSLQHSEKK